MTSRAILVASVLSLLGLGMLGYAATLTWILMLPSPLEHPLAKLPLWPVACSLRGCLNTTTWLTYQTTASHFAEATHTEAPAIEESLTTALRAHLLSQAYTKAPVTLEDARRYREVVLRLGEDAPLLEEMHYTAAEYDEQILLPFLLQEALRQQLRVESTDELYKVLEQQRKVWVLPRNLVWNSDWATVIRQQ